MADIRVDAKRLDAVMTLRGVDEHELARRMGMHYNGVKRIQREQSTSLVGLENLCAALECHPFDLIVAQGFPEPFSVAPVHR
jgi:DNA-binding Xre family transcriptional regulator